MSGKLNVFADGKWVGILTNKAGRLSFAYAASWLADEAAFPLTIDIPLSNKTYLGDAVEAFFENLLPEGEVLEFVSRLIHISPGNTFGLLKRFGGDTAGAFSVLPDGASPSTEPNYLPITREDINRWFQKSRGIPLNLAGKKARMSLLSGAQDKMAVLIDNDGNIALPLGTAPSSHIIKPSSLRPDLPRTAINEAMIMLLAKEIDFRVADVSYDSLLDAVIVKRYDRFVDPANNLRRLHQNDLCQVLGVPSDNKYEYEGGPSLQKCFEAVLSHSNQPAIDKKRLIEWIVFNVLVGNMDGHAKNLSLLISDGNTSLAPFYDLVCTAVYPLSPRFAFKIGNENRPYWMTALRWERFAAEINVKPQFVFKTQRDIIDRIESALPIVTQRLKALGINSDNQAMMDNICLLIGQNIRQMKSRQPNSKDEEQPTIPASENPVDTDLNQDDSGFRFPS